MLGGSIWNTDHERRYFTWPGVYVADNCAVFKSSDSTHSMKYWLVNGNSQFSDRDQIIPDLGNVIPYLVDHPTNRR